MSARSLIVFTLLIPILLSAVEGAELGRPVLGFVFDGTERALRPIWGIPGASILGEPVRIDNLPLSSAVVSPTQDFALGVNALGDEVFVLGLAQSPVTASSLVTLTSPVSQIAFSPRGQAAGLISAGGRSFRIVTGLPNSPRFSPIVDLSRLPGTLGSVAIRDDGQMALFGVQGSEETVLYAASSAGDIQWVTRLGRVTAITFFRLGNDALVADAGTAEILRIRIPGYTVENVVSLIQGKEVYRPAAIALSDDDSRLFVTTDRSGQILSLHLQERRVEAIPLTGKVTGLNRLSGNSIFRLNELSNEPLLVLNGGLPVPGIVFVPALERTKQGDNGLFSLPRGEPHPVSVRERRASQ